MDLVKKLLKGDKLALAQAISAVENNSPASIKILDQIYPHLGKGYRLGITGPPGVGKSTLINELIIHLRQQKRTVGVLAIDPSSIFTGGALLGDRIRMQKPSMDNGVFIRSMATRGCLGGVAQATAQAADLLDAAGKNYILTETVGVGQTEIAISQNVDLTIVVLSPESGDAIQAMKAGILEVADLIIINKADRPGVDLIINNLKHIFELRARNKHVVILKTSANQGTGIPELLQELETILAQRKQSGMLKKRREESLSGRLKSLIASKFEQAVWLSPKINHRLKESVKQINARKTTPYRAAAEMINGLMTSLEKK
jgi:LAO/AO transport system kinase